VITDLTPVVALALGAAVLGEQVTVTAVAGLALVLADSWLATEGRLPQAVRRATTAAVCLLEERR